MAATFLCSKVSVKMFRMVDLLNIYTNKNSFIITANVLPENLHFCIFVLLKSVPILCIRVPMLPVGIEITEIIADFQTLSYPSSS